MDEPTLMQQLLQIIIPFAVAAVSALTTWALYELKKWIKQRTDNEAVNEAVGILSQVVQTTVTKLNETVKQAGADGIITQEEAQKLKSAAVLQINQQIPDATRKILNLGIKNLDDYISGQIELAVIVTKRMKTDAGIVEPRMPAQ